MTFKFKLNALLRVRRHQENIQKRFLAEAMRVVQNLETQILETAQELTDFSKQESPLAVTPGRIEMRYAYIHQLHKQRFDLEKDLKKARDEAEKQRLKLVELHRKTKILENLEAKKQLEFIQEENRLEMLELNEIATIRFNRNRR
jgi:flagellar protein FliJ